MAERAYRRALVKEHIAAARLMAAHGQGQEILDRERAIIALIWGQYRALIKAYKKGTV